jgi:hypothetical protein
VREGLCVYAFAHRAGARPYLLLLRRRELGGVCPSGNKPRQSPGEKLRASPLPCVRVLPVAHVPACRAPEVARLAGRQRGAAAPWRDSRGNRGYRRRGPTPVESRHDALGRIPPVERRGHERCARPCAAGREVRPVSPLQPERGEHAAPKAAARRPGRHHRGPGGQPCYSGFTVSPTGPATDPTVRQQRGVRWATRDTLPSARLLTTSRWPFGG